MELLGALGFDWKIFIIQAINFIILFYILKKLFFKPFISAIKKEKEETDRIRRESEAINFEKEKWEKEKKEQLLKAKADVEKILSEAEEISRKNKEEAKKEEIKREKDAINLIKKQSKAILDSYKDDLNKNYKSRVKKSLLSIFDKNFSKEVKIKIQNNFWNDFVEKLKKMNFPETIRIDKRKKHFQLKDRTKKNVLKKKELKFFSVFPIDTAQKNIIEEIFKEKFPKTNFKLIRKIDKNLIAGFRLEVEGFLFEQNLKEKIEKIFEQ